jgi:hypothetical protein
MLVLHPDSRPVRLENGDESLRAQDGSIIGGRVKVERSTVMRLGGMAAALLGGSTRLDLAPSDVVQPGTQADYGTPSIHRDCVADIVSPIQYVRRNTGYYYVETVADALQLVEAASDLVGRAAMVSPGFTPTKFLTVGYALATKLPRQVVGNADFDILARVTRRLCESLRLLRELRVATQVTTSGNFAAGNRVPALGAAWNGGGGAHPLTDVFAALKTSYLPADTLVLPENAAPYFHTGNDNSIRDFVQAGGQLPRILYARSKVSNAAAAAYTWMPSGTGAVALVRTTGIWLPPYGTRWDPSQTDGEPPMEWHPNDRQTDIGTTHTLRWVGEDGMRRQKLAPGDRADRIDGVLVRVFTDDQDAGSVWVSIAHNDIEIMPSNQVGAIITGAMA